MGTPFISICIPTYQRTSLLKKLLDSVMEQSFRDFEVLVNDNSPDDSVSKLVSEYAALLPISYQKNEPAVNAAGNCIKVMRRANAPWIKLVHDDDWFAGRDALEKFATAARESGKDFIFSACNKVDLQTNETEEENLSEVHAKMLGNSIHSLFYLNVIGHPSVVMHRNDPSIEYDANLHWVLDIDFYMRYLDKHKGYYYIDERLVNIGKGPTQESFKYYKNPLVEIPEYFTLLCKYPTSLPLENPFVFHLIWNMISRYKIKDTEQIRSLGYQGAMPLVIESIIACQKKIPRIILKQPPWSKKLMLRCYKNLKAQGLKR